MHLGQALEQEATFERGQMGLQEFHRCVVCKSRFLSEVAKHFTPIGTVMQISGYALPDGSF